MDNQPQETRGEKLTRLFEGPAGAGAAILATVLAFSACATCMVSEMMKKPEPQMGKKTDGKKKENLDAPATDEKKSDQEPEAPGGFIDNGSGNNPRQMENEMGGHRGHRTNILRLKIDEEAAPGGDQYAPPIGGKMISPK